MARQRSSAVEQGTHKPLVAGSSPAAATTPHKSTCTDQGIQSRKVRKMPADVGSIVHPWYKGVHEWRVKEVAKLANPVEYRDAEQGNVEYDPKIMLLESKSVGEVLWFPYWMSTNKTKGKMKWGQRPSMLEEQVFFELTRVAIKKGMFSNRLLNKLGKEIQAKLAY